MKLQDLKKSFKNIFDTVIDFVIKNKRYFIAGLVFVAIILILFGCTDQKPKTTDPMDGVYQEYKENKDKALADLITSYYKAYADGDIETLETLANPISKEEMSYISFYSQYIDSFDNISIFTKKGFTDNAYIVSVVVDLKFAGIDTAAPGFDFFYVEKDESGKYMINNLYGSFNQANGIYEMNSDVTSLIAAFISQEDVLAKKNEVQTRYNEAILSDENLSNFVNNTLQDAIVQWNVTYQQEVEAEKAAAAEAEEQAAKEAEEAEAAEKAAAEEAEEAANSKTGTVKKNVNVRSAADSSSDKLGKLESGAKVTVYGAEGDFYKIDYNGKKAYVASEFISMGDDSTGDDNEAANTNVSFEKGTEITLNQTINIRSAMDSSSSKVAVAYEGDKVTVVMSYAEGWTKVKFKKKEGFIRTDLLTE